VLLHKVDSDSYITDEHRSDSHAEIKRTILEEFRLAKLPLRITFHLTSIFDHSVFEALSRVVQQLIPQLGLMEKLLDGLLSSCVMDKVFVFDVLSKLYLSTDSSRMDSQVRRRKI